MKACSFVILFPFLNYGFNNACNNGSKLLHNFISDLIFTTLTPALRRKIAKQAGVTLLWRKKTYFLSSIIFFIDYNWIVFTILRCIKIVKNEYSAVSIPLLSFILCIKSYTLFSIQTHAALITFRPDYDLTGVLKHVWFSCHTLTSAGEDKCILTVQYQLEKQGCPLLGWRKISPDHYLSPLWHICFSGDLRPYWSTDYISLETDEQYNLCGQVQ